MAPNYFPNISRLQSLVGSCSVFPIHHVSSESIPFFGAKIPAGFPSPADDYLEDKIDLNKLVSKNSPATFILRVKGLSMVDAGIQEDDYLVVDRSITPTDGKIVVVAVDGEVTVKKLCIKNGKTTLQAANPSFESIHVNENANVEIFGVVVSVVHFF